jgi:thiamine-phosphate diphosphorylase
VKVPGRLYAVVDPCGDNLDPVEIAADLLEGGARVLQLRWKNAGVDDIKRVGREILRHGSPYDAQLIINDHMDVALAIGAHGVHLGQEDLPADVARPLLRKLILGISTHDLEQAQAAEQSGADYIGFGPMFATMTKDTGYSTRGLDHLRQIRRAVRIPIVAIGGIHASNAARCLHAGADAVAMISGLVLAQNRVRAVREALCATAV